MKVTCIKNTYLLKNFPYRETEHIYPLTVGKIYDVSIACFDNTDKNFVVYNEKNKWDRYSPDLFEGNIDAEKREGL